MFEDTKYKVAVGNRVLSEVGLAAGPLASLGHQSLRVPEDPNKFVVKGRGYSMDALAMMRPSDMVVCDINGYFVEGPPGARQCSEVQLHACIYKTHPEVNSVVHVHPRFAVIMSVLQSRLVPMCNEGIELVRRPLPVYRHNKIVQSEAEGLELASVLGDSKAVLLLGHGAATVGATQAESFLNMYNLEEQARMNWYGYCAAGPDHPGIPDDLLAEPGIPRSSLPHFTDAPSPIGERIPGVWAYYTNLVEKRLETEGIKVTV